MKSPMRWVAFRPDPVSTTTVASSGRIAPLAMRRVRPAAAKAEVGSA